MAIALVVNGSQTLYKPKRPSSPSQRAMWTDGQGLAAVYAICVLVVSAPKCYVGGQEDEPCETLPSEIHIIKEEFDDLGRLQRTCNGEIAVNKCEGACNSQVQPSVITPTGFLKECYCCRESFLRERVVTLTHCYDPDGTRLTEDGKNTMDIRMKEPTECRCFKCGDFSR